MANTWCCRDCGRVVAFYADGGWENEPERHAPGCGYWNAWSDEQEQDDADEEPESDAPG